MKRYVLCISVMLSLFSHASFATIKGQVDALFIEDGKWHLAGWACQQGTNLHPTVKFWSGSGSSTYLGSTTANLTSEPAVKATCSSSQNDLRWKFEISNSDLATIDGFGIKVEGNIGLDKAALTNSMSFEVPTNYTNDPYSDMENASKIMFFGAHPDDEIYGAILFGDLCNDVGITCKFAVTTTAYDGAPASENATVRSAEMTDSAALFDADLELDTLSSKNPSRTVSATLSAWATEIGKPEASDWAKDLISNFDPDFIMTFDPRNGVTCHQEHRAVAEMVIDAAGELSFPDSDLILFTLFPRINLAPGTNPHPEVGMWRDDAFDTGRHWSYSGDTTVSGGPTAWDYVLDVMVEHDSQFTAEQRDRAEPLHYTSAHHTSSQWVGNDVTGRLMTLHRYSDYSASETPYTATAQGCSP